MFRPRLLLSSLLMLVLALSVALAGCKSDPEARKASLESSINKDIDQLELKAGKLPVQKVAILKKVEDFKKALDDAKGDETKLRRLDERVDKYLQEVEKMAKAPGGKMGTQMGGGVAPAGAPPVGSKVGAPAGNNMGGNKMGGTGTNTMGGAGGNNMGGTGGNTMGGSNTMGGTGGGGKLGGGTGTNTMGGGSKMGGSGSGSKMGGK